MIEEHLSCIIKLEMVLFTDLCFFDTRSSSNIQIVYVMINLIIDILKIKLFPSFGIWLPDINIFTNN